MVVKTVLLAVLVVGLSAGVAAAQAGSIGALRSHCGELTFEGEGMDTVHTNPTVTIPAEGYRGELGISGMEWERLCPDGQVVVGIGGRAGLLLEEITVHCAVVEAVLGAGGYRLSAVPYQKYLRLTILPQVRHSSSSLRRY